MWQFVVSCGLPHFYGNIGGYMVIYVNKDKNKTQGIKDELLMNKINNLILVSGS